MTAVEPRAGGAGGRLIAGLVGLVLGAAIVGGAWLLVGRGGGTPDTPVALPDTVGAFVRNADHPLSQDEGRDNAERIEAWNVRSGERLSAAHGGAPAAVERYADEGYDSQFSLLVVRAAAPSPPFVPYIEAEALGLARPPLELQEFAEVACEVRNDPVPEGAEARPEATHVVVCQRTDADLTVQVRDIGGDLGTDPRQVAQLVDTAWAALRP